MNKPYNVKCPNCGKEFGVFSSTNSGFTDCPHCQHEFSWKEGFNNCWEIIAPPVPAPVNKDHPLLNPDSKHYDMIGGVQAIELMESMFTVEELMAWAKLTAMKYRLRIGDKDAPEKEVKKIKTFEAYYKYLEKKQCKQ